MNTELGIVQETALIPLAIKASESKGKKRIYDYKAVEIIEKLGIENTSKYDKYLSHEGVVARTIMFDDTVKKLIEKYPDTLCVNIGSGFDNRFERVDNGRIIWYNIDLPDSIALREKFFEKRQREYCIAADVTKKGWYSGIEGIDKRKPCVIIAEGLLMYFSENEIKELMHSIQEGFGCGYFVAELMHPAVANNGQYHDTLKSTNAHFKWGVEKAKEMETYCKGWKCLSDRSFFDVMKRYSLLGKIGNLFFRKYNDRIAVLSFDEKQTML